MPCVTPCTAFKMTGLEGESVSQRALNFQEIEVGHGASRHAQKSRQEGRRRECVRWRRGGHSSDQKKFGKEHLGVGDGRELGAGAWHIKTAMTGPATLLLFGAALILSPACDAGHDMHRPRGAELITVIPSLDAVNFADVWQALGVHVNVSRQIEAVQSWNEYRHACHMLAIARSGGAEPSAAAAEAALLQFASAVHAHRPQPASQLASPAAQHLYTLLAEVFRLKDTATSRPLAHRCLATAHRLAQDDAPQRPSPRVSPEQAGWIEQLALWRHPALPSAPASSARTPCAGEGSLGRVLVCQPTFGLGNRVNAVMMSTRRQRSRLYT